MLRRNPALTRDEFIAHYELRHSKFIGELTGVTHYVRRYVVAADGPTPSEPLDFDVIMETWFVDKAAHDRSFERLIETGIWNDVRQDEEYLFDRSNAGWCRAAVIDIEHSTDLSSPELRSSYVAARV